MFKHEASNTKTDDLTLIEQTSSATNKRVVEAVILTHVAISGIRLWLAPQFQIIVTNGVGGATLNLIKRF